MKETQAQYRSISSLRPELGRCFAGDSGMVISALLFSAVSIICISQLLSMKRCLFLRAVSEAKLLPVVIVFSGPVLSSGSSSAVSSLKRSVTPVVALPGLLSGDSFLCLMA